MKRQKQHAAKMKRQKHTLNDLSDCVLIRILSFLKAKEAVQTCILSSRWEHLWKHLTALTLNSSDFRTVKGFTEFVHGILSLRDYSKPLNAVDFECQGRVVSNELERTASDVLERIVRYADSHNINCLRLSYENGRFPHSFLMSCHSLTSLDIGSQSYDRQEKFPNSLNLPALTSLKLRHFTFYEGNNGRVEPFSTFNRLDTLILYGCTTWYEKLPLCISSTTLLNLSIYSSYVFFEEQKGFSNIELFTPSLFTFSLTCDPFPKLYGSYLSSIKQVSIDVRQVRPPLDTSDLLNFMIELTNMESLTITPKTLKVLSLVHDISKLKLTSLCNLKSLKINLNLKLCIFPEVTLRDIKLELAGGKSWKENAKLREIVKAGTCSSILDQMIEFLLQNSPSAKVDLLLES